MPLPRVLLVLLAAVAGAQEANYKLVFEDNFDGDKLNREVWEVRTGNKQRGNYTDEALDVKDGLLSITTWTENKVDFTGLIKIKKAHYLACRQGKVEGRIRFNPAQGVSTVFSQETDIDDLKLPQVNIDIAVAFGYEKGAAYHTGVSWKNPDGPRKELGQKNTVTVGKFWHTYGVEWDDSGYRITLDGRTRMTIKNAEGSATPRGIELGCALPARENASPKGGYGPKDRSKASFDVDWVKAWRYVPATK
jgi:hypothetical protein